MLRTKPLPCKALLCVRVSGGERLRGDLQWNFRTQRVSTGNIFLGGAKTLLFGTTRSPDAAAIVPLRSGSKATGNSESPITAFSFHSTALRSAPRLRLDRGPSFPGHVLDHCAIWPPGPGSGQNWLLEAPGAPAGRGSCVPLCPRTGVGWSASQAPLSWREDAPCSAGPQGMLVG